MPHFLTIVIYIKVSRLPHVLKLVVCGKQGHASCEMLSLIQIFYMSVKFYGEDKTVTNLS